MDLRPCVKNLDQPSVNLEIPTNNGNIPSSPMEPQNFDHEGLLGSEGTLGVSSGRRGSEIRTEANEFAPLEPLSEKQISAPLLDDGGSDRTWNINSENVNRTSRVRRKNKRISVLESDSDSEPYGTEGVEGDNRLVKDNNTSEFHSSDAKRSGRSGLLLDDSDSDNQEQGASSDHGKEVKGTEKVKCKSRIALVDSDSDSEEQIVTKPPEVIEDNLLAEDDGAASDLSTKSNNEKVVPETREKQHVSRALKLEEKFGLCNYNF